MSILLLHVFYVKILLRRTETTMFFGLDILLQVVGIACISNGETKMILLVLCKHEICKPQVHGVVVAFPK